MRKTSKLLIILIKDIQKHEYNESIVGTECGLCDTALKLFDSQEEYNKITTYIHENKPKKLWEPYIKGLSYFWEPRLVEPRLNWLYYHRRKCKLRGD